MPTVSACLITRNEAVHLADCLASVQPHVDEIVIVDTGSSDQTLAIAERFGCRVLHQAWQDDFARPRNLGIAHAHGDWILYIDADERLSCTGGRRLQGLLPGDHAAAAVVKFIPRTDMTPYCEYRLFRRDPRIRFVGTMHETMVPGIERVCAEDQRVVVQLLDVVLSHRGYDGDQTAKHHRDLPLLRQAIREDPQRVYLRYHLGVTLDALGRRDDAGCQLNAGIALASAGERSPRSRVEGSMCAQVLAAINLAAHDDDALTIVDQGLALYPANLALQWLRGRCLIELGRVGEAVAAVSPLLVHEADTFFDPAIAYEKSLFGEDSLGLLGAAAFRLGEYGKAADYYDRAAAVAADPLEFTSKAALARARAARSRLVKNAGGAQPAEIAAANPVGHHLKGGCNDDLPQVRDDAARSLRTP
jgi:hypothetical protein